MQCPCATVQGLMRHSLQLLSPPLQRPSAPKQQRLTRLESSQHVGQLPGLQILHSNNAVTRCTIRFGYKCPTHLELDQHVGVFSQLPGPLQVCWPQVVEVMAVGWRVELGMHLVQGPEDGQLHNEGAIKTWLACTLQVGLQAAGPLLRAAQCLPCSLWSVLMLQGYSRPHTGLH